MRNTVENVKQKLISKYQEKSSKLNQVKSTDINVLLNRVKTNQKNESRRKIYFSAAASTGLILFGLLIF
tara:strand:+ start:22 stop:228 length:207 start_codon:yes stop_codon:yes gene_type:complete